MARTVLCESVTGNGTFKNFGLGSRGVLQIAASSTFTAVLSATTLNSGEMTQVLTATESDFYAFVALTDANYQLVVTDNLGTISAVLS